MIVAGALVVLVSVLALNLERRPVAIQGLVSDR
jgi:hypothetical protein